MSASSSNTLNSGSKLGRNVLCGCGVRAPLRTALTEPNVGRRFLGCVNYKKDDEGCKFFDWVDLPTCERGKDFGKWIVKKNDDLQKENVDLRAKIAELKEREEWFVMKMNCMNRNLKEMEDGFALKMEQYKNKNVGLRKRLKDEVEYGKKLVNVLTAMVVLLLGIGIFVCLGGKGMLKKKMLALP
ncbi:uncharacterized protein LOC131306878 [Rhododendron vialii]|uniref:uncharacterized protein LOC131306878 n=1 Tax=Rhododendron vialii TaxID=182163 RepID=UPI0026601133|nr:uncharacterized protein LOC131306878 [Rhododendron vialii]